jgi:hypothetical protein
MTPAAKSIDDGPLCDRSVLPRLFTRHTVDLWTILVCAALMLLSLWIFVWWSVGGGASPARGVDDSSRLWVGATTTLVGAWGALALRLFAIANERLGTVDLFTYEIISTCRVIVAVDLVQAFVTLYDDPQVSGIAGPARREEYFEHFHGMGLQIGGLNKSEVARITDFFVYLKGSRDATASFDLWRTADGFDKATYGAARRQEDVLHVLYLLFLVLEAAFYAIEGLARPIEFTFFRALVMPPMKDAYRLLLRVIPQQDQRWKLLQMPRRKKLLG